MSAPGIAPTPAPDRTGWRERGLIRALSGGSGRPLAIVALAAFLMLSLLSEPPVLDSLRLATLDTYQFLVPRARISAPATIVAVDEMSLAQYGQWPWPRSLLARLMDQIGKAKPAVIGVDLVMPEPDRLSLDRLSRSLPNLSPGLARQLARHPPNDEVLARSMRNLPVVLGTAGLEEAAPGSSAYPAGGAPFLTYGGDATPYLRHFAAALTSIDTIDQAARGHGLLSADPRRGVIRRVPLVASVGGLPAPAFALEVLRVAAGETDYRLSVGPEGMRGVGIGEMFIRTESDGGVWLHFGPRNATRFVSAAQVLSGKADPAQLERKIVLVGVTGLGLIDYQATPLGERMPGVEIHAQLLESIYDGNLLRRPTWLTHLERAVLIMCTILLMLAVPQVRPRYAAPVLAAMLAGLALLGFALYTTQGLLFDPSFAAAGATVAFGVLLGGTLAESDRHKRRLERALQVERDAALRTAGELEAAWRIQVGMLPPPTAEALHEPRIELQARIEPARLVGGDFYDYFLLDADRLFFCIGDVAGKGLPASLFMAVCKALLKSIALRSATDTAMDLGALMRAAEREIARDNPEMLFVTLFIGVLHLRSGELTYCNAGHEPPYLMPADGAGVQPLAGDAGPPLGVLEAFPYAQARGLLARGDTLLMYTDGVTEAMNCAGSLYGRETLAALLASLAQTNAPSEVVSSVGLSVRGFVGDAEQSDDFTLLALRRRREPA